MDGSLSYVGFSGKETTMVAPTKNPPNLSYLLSQDTSTTGYNNQVSQRLRNATVRALAATGQTRVWNLMIDIVAQTGYYPPVASSASNPLAAFMVQGEQRYWVHVAIDRYTGQVIDKQIEVVKE
ncbi:MAG: hypothetical protein QM796_21285 [Chthoniobacteraceae bacterium]